MNVELLKSHKTRNWLHTMVFVAAMSALVATSASLIFGEGVWLWVLSGAAMVFFLIPEVSPGRVLEKYQADRLNPIHEPRLYQTIQVLSNRAGLSKPPSLYRVPSQSLNAFAVGNRTDAVIAITDGLLAKLSPREIAGVLAHETSHIVNHDLRLMNLADLLSRISHVMTLFGLFLIILSLPLVLIGMVSISLWGLLFLILTPLISAALQFALSRVREFDADLDAVRLTGDPHGLASALHKIEQQEMSLWERLISPAKKSAEPSIFRSHPQTRERIRRLLSLNENPSFGYQKLFLEPGLLQLLRSGY